MPRFGRLISGLLVFFLVAAPLMAQTVGQLTTDQLTQQLHDQLAAVDAEHVREQGLLENEKTRAQADYQQKLVDCGAQNQACRDAANRDLLRRGREIEKKEVDADLRWQLQRSRIIAANQIMGLRASGVDSQCIRAIDSNSEKAALNAAEAKHIADLERIKEQQDTAQATYKKALIDCGNLASEQQQQCNNKANETLLQTDKVIQKQYIDANEALQESRDTINAIIAAKRSVYQGNEAALYQQGIQVGIANCIHQGISPLWTDPSAGVRIGTALAAGRIAQLVGLAGIAAVPGTVQSLQAVICGPPASSGNEDPYQRGIDDGQAYCKWVGQLASGAVASARSRVPILDVGTDRNMLGQAINYLKAAPANQRAAMFAQFADQIINVNPGWQANRVDLEGGGTIFYGEAGNALVFDPNGNMFLGSTTKIGQFDYGPGGTLIPNYSALKPIN